MWMMKDDQESVDSDIITLKLTESLGNNKIEKERNRKFSSKDLTWRMGEFGDIILPQVNKTKQKNGVWFSLCWI